MDRSDSHLESMLDELNDRVSSLEDGGSLQDLIQAYVNRGSVLYMLDYRTSAMEDFESASELVDRIGPVDPVTYLRIHCSIASILFSQGDDPSEEYWNASTRLKEIGPDAPYFDRRSLARVCISSIEELIDSGHPDDCEPFISKGLEIVNGSDKWSRNRRVEIWNLAGEADDECNDPSSAIDSYTGAVNEAISLMEEGLLEDSASLVLALSMRAAAETDLKRDEDAVRDLDAAITIMEGLLEHHSLPDTEPLVELHHDLAGALIRIGRTDEAEKHLIRAMEIGISRSVSDSNGDGFSD